MKSNEISATGVITEQGKLSMPLGEVNAFFAERKGQRVIATFHVVPTATSRAMLAYYYKYVVPTVARAAYEAGDRRTQLGTDRWLRELSVVCWDESVNAETGEYSERLRGVAELSNGEMVEYLDWLKQFAAENYNVYIEDPMNV